MIACAGQDRKNRQTLRPESRRRSVVPLEGETSERQKTKHGVTIMRHGTVTVKRSFISVLICDTGGTKLRHRVIR